jgi:hypothetical protein
MYNWDLMYGRMSNLYKVFVFFTSMFSLKMTVLDRNMLQKVINCSCEDGFCYINKLQVV